VDARYFTWLRGKHFCSFNDKWLEAIEVARLNFILDKHNLTATCCLITLSATHISTRIDDAVKSTVVIYVNNYTVAIFLYKDKD
jgi:hypothetical protein